MKYLVQTFQGGTWLTDGSWEALAPAKRYMATVTNLPVRIKVCGKPEPVLAK